MRDDLDGYGLSHSRDIVNAMMDCFFCLRCVACGSQLTGPLVWLSFTGTVHRPKVMDIATCCGGSQKVDFHGL